MFRISLFLLVLTPTLASASFYLGPDSDFQKELNKLSLTPPFKDAQKHYQESLDSSSASSRAKHLAFLEALSIPLEKYSQKCSFPTQKKTHSLPAEERVKNALNEIKLHQDQLKERFGEGKKTYRKRRLSPVDLSVIAAHVENVLKVNDKLQKFSPEPTESFNTF